MKAHQSLKIILIAGISLLSSCGIFDASNSKVEKEASSAQIPVYTAKVEKKSYPEIRTPKGANRLDLETPLRCFVNWDTQEMISTIPYNTKAFQLIRNGKNDALLRYEVNGLSFETMPAEKALLKLTKEAGIKLVAKDAPYSSISADNLRGDFSEVVTMITDAAEIYYTYNSTNKTMRISRKANFSLYIPRSKTIMLAVLDVLRGSGITDFTADFDDYSITFDADFELKNKIINLINYFEESPLLLAYDVKIFNLYPYNASGVEWQQIIEAFGFGSVKSAKDGVLGKILTTSNDINVDSLASFLSQQARVEAVGEGKFVVPNLWYSRFDIGKCISRSSILADLSILTKASFEGNDKIFSDITIEGRGGEISSFSIYNRLGENFLIIGLPNTAFASKSPQSETIIMLVPRVIKTTKTDKVLENNL